MYNYFIILLLFIKCYSYKYLYNSEIYYNVSQLGVDLWFDMPLSGYHNSYPPSGINCISGKSNSEIIYLISSQSLLNRQSDHDRCRFQKRTVSIFKRNLTSSSNIDHLVIGETYTGSNTYKCYRWNDEDMESFNNLHGNERHEKEVETCIKRGGYWRNHMNPLPHDCHCGCCQKIVKPEGGLGSDYVTSCGINEKLNILYYIGGNYHNCKDNFNTNPSIVRINLTDFKFIDRNNLNEIKNFDKYCMWNNSKLSKEKQYFNYPGNSQLINETIFLSFENVNTGIWTIDISRFPLEITNGFQKKIGITEIVPDGNSTKTIVNYVNIPTITKSYYYEEINTIYFISETFTDNALLLKINLTIDNYFENSSIYVLDGINNIKDIKVDTFHKKIYLLVGQLTSRIFKYDIDINMIPLSKSCKINSLNLPSDWRAGQNMEIDSLTGIIYVFFIKEPYNGFTTIRIKNLEIGKFNQFTFKRNGQLWTPIYMNTTFINRYTGKLFVGHRAESGSFFYAVSEIRLLGCAEGRKVQNNVCNLCSEGTYTYRKGMSYCNLCNYGSTTLGIESKECVMCEKGFYADNLGSMNCKSCKPGNYSEFRGSKICSQCIFGKYNIKTSSTSPSECIECDSGKYSNQGSNICKVCPSGKYTYEKRKCIDCPKGTYSDVIGIIYLEDCKNCPIGRYNNLTGSNNINNCINCEKGKYSTTLRSNSIDNCLDCDKGTYRDVNDNPSNCLICINGKYTNEKGSYVCKYCQKGMYNNGNSDIDHIKCLSCPKGKYNENIGANNIDKCLDCLKGQYSELENLTSISLCKKCEKGMYNPLEGSPSKSDCKECPQGRYRELNGGVSINDCINCPVGKYSINSFTCGSCLKGKYSDIPGSFECKNCPEGQYKNNNLTLTCNICPDNSEPNYDSSGCDCIDGTYTESKNPLVCKKCPDNFICKKGSTIETIILDKRYWRDNKKTLTIEKCRKSYSCLGGIIKNSSDDLCNEGHSGPLCDVCLEGWAKNEGKCFKCLTDISVKARSYIFTILFPIIISIIIFFMIKTANPSSSTAQKEPLSGVIKIFMNYAQIFTLASSFEINWPDSILLLFDRTKEFSSPKISFYSSDCTIGWKYYDKLLTYIILPIIYVLIVTIILTIYTFYFYKKNRELKLANYKWKNDKEKNLYLRKNPIPIIFYKAWICTSLLIGLFLAWPTIIKQSLSIIPCKKFGDKYYLLQDLSIECYTNKYFSYLVLSYVSLFIYGIVVPFIAFILIRSKRYSLYDFETKYEMPAPLSFLFLGYREETWYYEFVVMAKKYSLIAITVFLKEYSRYQMICASLFIQAAFFIHVFIRPYDSITNYGILCNKLESISLLALVVTLNSGLFFGTINDEYQLGSFEIFLIVLLFFMNVLVMIYFLYYLVKLSFSEASDFFKKTFKKLNENNFFLIKYISKENKNKLVKWSNIKKKDNHGINLKSPDEIELFEHYFNDKKSFAHDLKKILKNDSVNKIGTTLKKVRSKIEIIEKQRCWLSVLNNRLYKHLQNELVKNKDILELVNIEELNNILENYINNGIKYCKTINRISKKALNTIKRDSMIEMTEIIKNKNIDYDLSDNDEYTEELYNDIRNEILI